MKNRKFVSNELVIHAWENIQGYYHDLQNRDIKTLADFEQWLRDKSELDAVIEEDLAWRYIRMTIDTTDEKLSQSYSFFIENILPNIAPIEDELNQKLVRSPYLPTLEQRQEYFIYFRSVKKSIELFRKENIELDTQIQGKSKEYGAISAKQTIEWEGKTLTMQQASNLLKNTDEKIRKKAYEAISARRKQDIEQLENLFDDLIQLRHQTALNAGFENYRDYKLVAMGRFDYGLEECLAFHKAIKQVIVPLARKYQEEHRLKLNKTLLAPWDLDVDPDGHQPLKPFEKGTDLLKKSQLTFEELDPFFGECLHTMEKMTHLDLDSKNGKAPGGYNYPLYESGVPFIFMNAAGSQRDLVTMVHEGGHAVHSFLSKDLTLTAFKNLPSEVAELASMSMELLTMDLWSNFYGNPTDEKRAKREHFLDILKVLPWIATIDSFQHWIYENPNHTREQRKAKWLQLTEEYGNPNVDWNGFEDSKAYSWHRQLHLFEVPFYYIEYGIAQLGALGIWKNSKDDKEKAIKSYKEALSMGYTKSIPEIYETANVPFDFSKERLVELADLIEREMKTF